VGRLAAAPVRCHRLWHGASMRDGSQPRAPLTRRQCGTALAAPHAMRHDNRTAARLTARRFRSAATLVMTCALISGCLHSDPTPDEVQDPVTWGAAKSVRRIRHLWIADQPDAAGFDAAKSAGVRVVIDLRAPGERDWDEAALVESRGLAYYNVPVVGSEPFSRAAFEEVERLVKANKGEQILIHCSSGNRAAGWLTAHLVEAHDMPFESALVIGRRAGITRDPIVAKLANYLGEKESMGGDER